MWKSALAVLLSGTLAATCAWAGTPAEESVRGLAEILRSSASGLRASNDAPLLKGQLTALIAALKELVDEKAAPASDARPVEDEAAALVSELERAPKPLGGEFCRSAAGKVRAIAEEAGGLVSGADAAKTGVYVPDFRQAPPSPDAASLSELQKRSAAMASVMGKADFDGEPAAAPAPVPLALPRKVARVAEPVYGSQVAAYQGALNPFLKSRRRRALVVDGRPGGATEKAVAFFQREKGLPETGVVDRGTEKALLADFQRRRRLPVTGALDERTSESLPRDRRPAAARTRYYEGNGSDFEPKPRASTVKRVLATIYTPFLAKTRKARKMEGSTRDRHDQTVCTLEGFLAATCPYVSVAVDPRLRVPNGTPLLIPEISEMAGRTVRFRIVDTGSRKRFKGIGHIDIATDSSQYSGFGRLISGNRFTLILPEGLHPSDL